MKKHPIDYLVLTITEREWNAFRVYEDTERRDDNVLGIEGVKHLPGCDDRDDAIEQAVKPLKPGESRGYAIVSTIHLFLLPVRR